MINRPLAFTDVETTGLEPFRYIRPWYWPFTKQPIEWHEIIEIGLVLVRQKDLEIINTFNVKVKPKHPERITEDVIKVNGYNETEWRDAVSLEEAMRRYSFATENAIFCAHDVIFNWSFIEMAFRITGAPNDMDDHRIDLFTMAWSKLRNSSLVKFNQDSIAEFLDLPKEPFPHRAIDGAMAVYRNYKKLILLWPT